MFMNLLAASITSLSVWEWIIGSVLIVAALVIIFVVLLQEGRQANVGVISGAADTFLDKGAARTLDQKLAKWTKVIAVSFFVLVLAGMLVTKFLSNEAMSESETPDTSVSEQEDEHAGHDHATEDTTTTTTAAEEGAVNDATLAW